MKNFAASILALALVVPAVAQQPDPPAVVAHVLELSSDQITAWSDILHARQTALEPLAQQAQAQQQIVEHALAGANPDPLSVGTALVALHSIQVQIAATNAQSASAFEAILTPDQLQRLQAIRGAAQACPIIPVFQAAGLLDH